MNPFYLESGRLTVVFMNKSLTAVSTTPATMNTQILLSRPTMRRITPSLSGFTTTPTFSGSPLVIISARSVRWMTLSACCASFCKHTTSRTIRWCGLPLSEDLFRFLDSTTTPPPPFKTYCASLGCCCAMQQRPSHNCRPAIVRSSSSSQVRGAAVRNERPAAVQGVSNVVSASS